jgi:hypothetical protein
MGSFNDRKIMEEVNIVNDRIIKSVSQWKRRLQLLKKGVVSEENS